MDCSPPQEYQSQTINSAERLVIKTRLAAIEVEHQVRVLYACKSASPSWDYASAPDGYDVRFLYVHSLSWYLQVNAACDVIEASISNELTMHGWELRKALGLLKKGDAAIIEWLDSPVVYQTHGDFLRSMRKAARQTQQHQSLLHQHVRVARRLHREHLCSDRVSRDQYLYALRPLLTAVWLERKHGPAPLYFTDLVTGTITEPALRAAIQQWLRLPRNGSATGTPIPAINTFIEKELTRLESLLPALPENIDYAILDRLLLNTVLQVGLQTK